MYGSLAIGLAYLAKEFSGPVTQVIHSMAHLHLPVFLKSDALDDTWPDKLRFCS